MQTYQPSLIARNDTLLGICEAIGEDLGINANWLRVAFAVTVFFSLGLAVAAYLGAGVLVLASRLIWREPRKLAVQEEVAATEAAPAAAAAPATKEDELLLAA